ncbi:MAG: hypothetical protein P8Y05_01020, partial [Deinococcales bacterium]
MRTFRVVIILGAVGLVLSACNAFIPNQQLTNPLGLNNTKVTLGSTNITGLGTQALHTATFQGTKNTTLTDPDLSSVPGWVKPNGFKSALSAASVALTGTSSTLPSTLDVTEVIIKLTIQDGSGKPTLNWSYDTGQKTQLLTLTQTSCDTTTNQCSYSVAAGTDLNGSLVPVDLSSSDVGTLWTILDGGATTDNVTIDA